MKYFVRLDNETKGPFELWQFPGLGVTPDTYVWCKGMEQWATASTVPEVRDFFRYRISSRGQLKDASGEQLPFPSQPQGGDDEPVQAPLFPFGPTEEELNGPDISDRPRCSVTLAVLAALFCCPLTGIVAIVYCVRANTLWNKAADMDREMKKKAHEEARKGRMWTGITFFLGFILAGLVSRFLN